tara:strand:+ start:171 stop:944 length:774 start_codon:yes stop_codon:yes gene_type:complete
MATLTYDPTPADQPEFNEAEQEALQIGERQQVEEQNVYAGKFKDAEALEQAYIELQKKLGESKDEVSPTDQGEESTSEEEEEVETSPTQLMLADASNEYEEKGELSSETLAKLSELSSSDLINAYLEAQGQEPPVDDLTPDEAASIYNAVGGKEEYTNLIEWASNSLPPAAVEAYNDVVASGKSAAIQLALSGIRAAYVDSNGFEGETLSGTAAVDKVDAFRSQAEVIAAMQDPRYDKDPAYRQDVFNKLDRSNLNY